MGRLGSLGSVCPSVLPSFPCVDFWSHVGADLRCDAGFLVSAHGRELLAPHMGGFPRSWGWPPPPAPIPLSEVEPLSSPSLDGKGEMQDAEGLITCS